MGPRLLVVKRVSVLIRRLGKLRRMPIRFKVRLMMQLIKLKTLGILLRKGFAEFLVAD